MRRLIVLGAFWCAAACLVFAQGEAPKTPDSATGTIKGTVYDSQTGSVLRSALIRTQEGGFTTKTDLDGNYTLRLAPGKYTIRVAMEGYFDQPVEAVEVVAGRVVSIDPILVPRNLISNEKVVVTADTPQAATFKSIVLARKMAETISDGISSEDIRKNPDSDAAAVLERVTGVSVVDDKFVFVRGLGERYSSTQVNGSMVPSTDPERKVVAFDLFPAGLIDKISTLKSYTPDQPGDFSGALVKVDTIEFPPEFIFKYSANVGFNTSVSLKPTLGYRGGKWDWLGFGYGAREMPDSFPDSRITKKNDLTGSGFSPTELQDFGRSLRNEWEAQSDRADPDFSQSVTVGGTVGKLGAVFSLTGSRKFARVSETINSYQALNGELIPWSLFNNDRNSETVKMGLVGNLSYKLGRDHKLLWKNFYTRDSNDETRLLSGYSVGNTADERNTRLRYLQETMATSQVAGEHYLPNIFNSLLEWRMAYSKATRREPDLRETIYRSEQGKDDYFFSPEGQSGFRQYSDQQDRIYEPGFDWTKDFMHQEMRVTFKFGGLLQHRIRDFSSRRFVFQILDRRLDLRQSPEQLFQNGNIAPNKIELREVTRFTDNFDAQQNIYAGYAMTDLFLNSRWRVLGGVRYEDSRIRLNTFDPYKPNLTPQVTKLDHGDFLPTTSVIYALRKTMNIRTSYSYTLNRPEFREMAPFQFTDISGRSTIIGNPNLEQSRISNYDIRWEWFPNDSDLFAASFFVKDFNKPIERVLFYSADLLTSFANIQGATNRGIELEVKKRLDFLSGRLANFSLYGNYSRIHSNVEIGPLPGLVLTSAHRSLQGQADNIFNLNLEYSNLRIGSDFRLLYNLIGSRIAEVGANQQPDVYEQPNHYLDFSFGQRFRGLNKMQLKFTFQNILNREIRELQGNQLYSGYRTGRSFGMGISYDLY